MGEPDKQLWHPATLQEQKAKQRHKEYERKRDAKNRDRQMYHLRHTRDYEALEVPIGTSRADIKTAYRRASIFFLLLYSWLFINHPPQLLRQAPGAPPRLAPTVLGQAPLLGSCWWGAVLLCMAMPPTQCSESSTFASLRLVRLSEDCAYF